MNRNKLKMLICMNILLAFYSFGGIFSKLAAKQSFMSLQFLLAYGGVLAILALYAIGWQQIIKRLPLTVAFANKAITIVWGLVLGTVFFRESVTAGKIFGAIIVIVGVVLYSLSDGERKDE